MKIDAITTKLRELDAEETDDATTVAIKALKAKQTRYEKQLQNYQLLCLYTRSWKQ